MNEQLMKATDICTAYIDIKPSVRKAFAWTGSSFTMPVCSVILASSGKSFTAEQLKDYRRMIKDSTGVFSNFRGIVMEPMTCMLAASDDPQALLKSTLDAYAALKAHFFSDEYIALCAIIIAQLASAQDFEMLAQRTRNIYDRMKKKHPLVTAREDVPFAAMLAFSDMSDDECSLHAEECFSLLRNGFVFANAAQSLSNVLALGNGSAEEKCQKVIDLYDALRLRGYRFGKSYEISILAAVSMLPLSVNEIADEIVRISDTLKGTKGYGFFGAGKRERLQHAAMIVSTSLSGSPEMNAAVNSSLSSSIGSAIAIIAAQQAAICAAIIAASAASNASSD